MEDERHQNNKRMTATERLVAENKQKDEEDETLKGEKRKRDLAQNAVEDAARERKAMEEAARTENDEVEEQWKAEERRRGEMTLESTAESGGEEDRMELDMSPIRGPHRSPLQKKKKKNKKGPRRTKPVKHRRCRHMQRRRSHLRPPSYVKGNSRELRPPLRPKGKSCYRHTATNINAICGIWRLNLDLRTNTRSSLWHCVSSMKME